MEFHPQYAENIIVFIVCDDVRSWYVTEKDYWYLDLIKLHSEMVNAYSESKMQLPAGYIDDFSERHDIAVLNKDTAKDFLESIGSLRATVEELRELFVDSVVISEDDDALLDFVPSLYVDFDKSILYSYYPEMIEFEKYIPSGWKGEYRNFFPLIPSELRYWVVDGKDIFSEVDSLS